MMLLLNRPGGWTFGSSIALTLEMNTAVSLKSMPAQFHIPLLADDSDAIPLPGSSELQYNVLVYGWTQKNRLCFFSLWPLPTTRRVYLCRYSPIIVCVMAWMVTGSVAPVVAGARGAWCMLPSDDMLTFSCEPMMLEAAELSSLVFGPEMTFVARRLTLSRDLAHAASSLTVELPVF